MSTIPTSVPELIDRWKPIGAFATAIGCGYEAARQMIYRGRIAPEHWANVVAAAEKHGVRGITYEWLADQWANPKPKLPTPQSDPVSA